MKIDFTEIGWSEYLYWQLEDRKKVKKINELIKSIERDGPLEGIGKPEKLKGDLAGECSRQIDDKNRLVYHVEDNVLTISQCRGHYNDH